mmetsp:Transcript_12245/g.18779  ORF Transcript_12245/g.18779 Transcript_12245/m.18779 type:complete len:117 (-) Transcript_12245:184-534(-)
MPRFTTTFLMLLAVASPLISHGFTAISNQHAATTKLSSTAAPSLEQEAPTKTKAPPSEFLEECITRMRIDETSERIATTIMQKYRGSAYLGLIGAKTDTPTKTVKLTPKKKKSLGE